MGWEGSTREALSWAHSVVYTKPQSRERSCQVCVTVDHRSVTARSAHRHRDVALSYLTFLTRFSASARETERDSSAACEPRGASGLS